MRSSIRGMQMKKNLGKICIIFLLFTTTIFAKQAAIYKLTADKTTAYIKEAVKITFYAEQKDNTNVMFFFVHPLKSDDYEIKLLTKEFSDKGYHHSIATYTYVLFPLQAKKINLNFEFSVKTASDQGVAHAYVEDHDDSKGIELKMTNIDVQPFSINVKKLAHPVDLVGDFELKSTIDKTKINQFETVNIHYLLNGKGYDNAINLLDHLEGVTIFSEQNNIINKLTKNGYEISRDYTYSLSAKGNFTIPKIELSAYSPAKKSYYNLDIPAQNITVDKIDTSSLIDKEPYPKNEPLVTATSVKTYLIYLLLFILGYLTAKLTAFKIKRKKSLFDDIKKSSKPKELIFVLLNKYSDKPIDKFIDELEKINYGKSNKTFGEVKSSVLEEFM
jgi:hypothetical protein